MLYLRRVRRLDGLRLMGKPIDELFPEPKTAEELAFTYELQPTQGHVRRAIQQCEGQHVQQVCYSTYMDALTQVCFTERVIRSTVLWNGSRSWSVEPK